ncbi:hypothetical protein R2B67_17990 [Streptomyces cyaneofuscatus]|uniref:DUF6941 family protein n=1 Tax=Streptomyces cyaneofuscatus TaxID=66883 RepID=UPI002953BE42|nr:hypothetical protein [Streptomyces cyaneofuscatus]WOP10315.1 hypothetical protein R2B67_17990 [Streptomyces cyaneofuscatus]
MKLNMAVLCDRATVREGLLHILGAGVTRCSLALPGAPDLDLAILLQGEGLDDLAGRHTMTVEIKDSEGQGVGRAELGWDGPTVDPSAAEDLIPQLPVAIPIRAIQFTNPGEHTVTVAVDGHELTRLSVFITKAEIPGVTFRMA